MSTPNPLVDKIVASIKAGEDFTQHVAQDLRYVLGACARAVKGRDKMDLGLEGLPKDSRKLVEMGVFCIDGDYCGVDRRIYAAIKDKESKQSRLLEKLKQLAQENRDFSPEELAEFQ